MISTSHLHRRSSRSVAFNGRQVLWFEFGAFCQGSVRRKSILIYHKFLNKLAGTSAFITQSTAATTQLICSSSKFDGTDFIACQRFLADLVHPDISKILDGQLLHEPLYLTRRGRGRPVTRGVTTGRSVLADAMEG